jgi:flavin reductase (DIM6/NTAB) family NADH-FMN oxidoreductase RutF
MQTEPRSAALGRVPSGIFIVTARHDGQETGMLASWIQQCSFQPPLVTFALKQGRYLRDWLAVGAVFTINILDDTQTDLISHFGRGFEPHEHAFADLELRRRPDAPPILTDCLAYLDVRVTARHPAGDHELFLAEIIQGGMLNEGRPMVHVRKSGGHY